MERGIGEFLITDDKARAGIDYMTQSLWFSYWARNRSRADTVAAVAGSEVISLFHGERQIGFARLVGDKALVAHLCDVWIEPAYRGRGLGREMLRFILDLDWVRNLRSMGLGTSDAQGFYAGFGFRPNTYPRMTKDLKRRIKIYEQE